MILFFYFFSHIAADTASDFDSYGHWHCWTASASCPYYSCRHHAKPVGLVLLRVCCSRIRAKTASIICTFLLGFVHKAGPAPFVPDVVGDHTHTHSPRTQITRPHKPCPLEAAAARVEGARRCCILAAAGPIACGVCLHLKIATRSLPFANHTKQQHINLIGAVFSEAQSYLENRAYDKRSRTRLVRRRNEY